MNIFTNHFPSPLSTGNPMGFGNAASSTMQLMLIAQMTQLMMSLMQMMFGGQTSPMSMGNPGFGTGQGGGFGPTPASFLGGSGGGQPSFGAAPVAPGAPASGPAEVGGESAGGGWVKPVDNYRISSRFGPRRAPTAGASTNHKGIDLSAPLNTPVRAAKAGRVSISKEQATGYGKWIEIVHDDGTKSRYGHLNSRDVQVGARVQAGQVIGKMGSTGTSTGSHLHFEVFDKSGKQVNPESVMRL
jgi:murein DD-endopeptidase MepM/ murein hydrolase activator NlpD